MSDLTKLYEAARVYDATYLAAKALADSAQYRVEQTEALARPPPASHPARQATELPPRRATLTR